MNATEKPEAFRCGILALAATVAALLGACSKAQSQAPQPIKIDGSSTVYPITQAVAKEYQATNAGTKVEVSFSGTGGGFAKFCAGETDISNASRPITTAEMEACNKAGVRFTELPVAFDALTVVVNPQNSWANDITVAELQKIWEPAAQGKITSWKQIRPSWPDKPLKLYGAGKDSGTFDYFTEATVGQPKASRTDYTASEDDLVLVRGVSQDPNALGYFGYAYYEDSKDKLKALAIDSGTGPVLPSRQTVEKSQYQPLARPLFIYVSVKSAQENPAVKAFVEYYLKNAKRTVASVGYIPLPDEGYHLGYVHFERGKVGTVFEGKAELKLTIGELLRKEAKF